MNKIIIAVAILILGGIIWAARPEKQNNIVPASAGMGSLIVEEANNYDFGSISMTAGKVKHLFKIKNAGDEPVSVNKMYTSCMCTAASLIKNGERFGPYGMPGHGFIPRIDQTIGPNEEAEIEVVFDPAAHGPAGVGKIERVIIIENDAGERIELQFSATVTP